MSLRPQHARPAPLHETLARQLSQRDLRMVETTLAFYEPSEVLEALAWIVVAESRKERTRRKRGKHVVDLLNGIYFCWAYMTWTKTGDWLSLLAVGLALRVAAIFLKAQTGGPTLRGQNARFILPACIQRASRQSLGVVLALAEFGLQGGEAERAACRSFLEVALVRAPTTELQALTETQRQALQTVTRLALKRSHSDTRYAQLASAGLLALGTLRDPALRDKATQTTAYHPSSSVQAAAIEYLSQL